MIGEHRSMAGIEPYKLIIGECCNPECGTSYSLETHHIQPVSQDGASECENYIVLCQSCHQQGDKHTDWLQWQERLYQWKFYKELLIIGHTSDDYSHDEYIKLMRATRKAKDICI